MVEVSFVSCTLSVYFVVYFSKTTTFNYTVGVMLLTLSAINLLTASLKLHHFHIVKIRPDIESPSNCRLRGSVLNGQSMTGVILVQWHHHLQCGHLIGVKKSPIFNKKRPRLNKPKQKLPQLNRTFVPKVTNSKNIWKKAPNPHKNLPNGIKSSHLVTAGGHTPDCQLWRLGHYIFVQLPQKLSLFSEPRSRNRFESAAPSFLSFHWNHFFLSPAFSFDSVGRLRSFEPIASKNFFFSQMLQKKIFEWKNIKAN